MAIEKKEKDGIRAGNLVGDLAAKREYLKKFTNTGGGEPIEAGHKWTTEDRDPDQGRDPNTGQFIDNESIGRDTKYPHRGKNLVPYIMRGIFRNLLILNGLSGDEEALRGEEGEKFLEGVKLHIGDTLRNGAVKAILKEEEISAPELFAMLGINALTDKRYAGGDFEKSFALARDNSKVGDTDVYAPRTGDREKRVDSQGHWSGNDDWTDDDLSTEEKNHRFVDNLLKKDFDGNYECRMNSDDIDRLAGGIVSGSGITGDKAYKLNDAIKKRLGNIAETFAQNFDRYAKDGSDMDKIKNRVCQKVLGGTGLENDEEAVSFVNSCLFKEHDEETDDGGVVTKDPMLKNFPEYDDGKAAPGERHRFRELTFERGKVKAETARKAKSISESKARGQVNSVIGNLRNRTEAGSATKGLYEAGAPGHEKMNWPYYHKLVDEEGTSPREAGRKAFNRGNKLDVLYRNDLKGGMSKKDAETRYRKRVEAIKYHRKTGKWPWEE
jgi:hypothetical protein